MTNQKTSVVPNVIGVVAVIVIAAILVSIVRGQGDPLPERMPPDPFETDRIHEITLRVDWWPDRHDPDLERVMSVSWSVGDDVGTATLFQEDAPFQHLTTARSNTFIELLATPDGYGPMICQVFDGDDIIGEVSTSDIDGCLVEVLVQ